MPIMIYFAAYTAAEIPNAHQWPHNTQNSPFLWGSRPHLIHGSLGPHESAPKRHLDRFSRFCGAHERDQQTDRHTQRQTTLLRV